MEELLFEVVSVNICSQAGFPKKPCDEAEVDEMGLKGDAHRGTKRPVSLLDERDIAVFRRVLGDVGPGSFAENITFKVLADTRGGSQAGAGLRKGDVLEFEGGPALQVIGVGKKCHAECEIRRKVGRCAMPTSGIFASVLKGGRIKRGDRFWINSRPR